MPGAHFYVFKNLRPPVAIDSKDGSPLRSIKAKELFMKSRGSYSDQSRFGLSKESIVKDFTDDGLLVDNYWNKRHHVKAS